MNIHNIDQIKHLQSSALLYAQAVTTPKDNLQTELIYRELALAKLIEAALALAPFHAPAGKP